MNLEEAFTILKNAGLYVRHSEWGSVWGGSHYDFSGGLIRVIENGFVISCEGETYRVRTQAHGQSDGIGGLPLEEALQIVLDTVKPQPNIEAPTRPVPKGTVQY